MLQRRHRAAPLRRLGAGWAWVPLAMAALLLSTAPVWAQEQGLTVQLSGFIADDQSQAQAVVTVLDGEGRSVPGLTEEQFQAWLNGAPAPVLDLAQGVDSSLPIAVVLALDVSGSMEGGALEQAKVAARRFLDGLGPQDSVAVLTFHGSVDLVQPFTQDRAIAGAAIDGLAASGTTALYQATAESVRRAAAASTSRRAVVLLSDGLDNGSALSRDEALATAETLGIPVFVIGLGADIDRVYLRELARASGGQFAETPSPEGLARLYQEVGELLRGQYVLTLDASGLDLAAAEPAMLRVEATAGEWSGGAERLVCPQRLCVALKGVEPGERLEAARTVVAEVVSADPVASVTFLVDGDPSLELADPPYQFAFDPAAFPDGDRTVSVEVATLAGETASREVAVRIGAAGGISSNLLLIAAVVIVAAGLVAAALFLYLRRRRPRGEEGPRPVRLRVPPAGPSAPRERRRPLPVGEPPPPSPAPQSLGRLHCTAGPLVGQTFPVGSAPVSMGSGHRCLIRLPAELESGQEIASEQARVWIREGHLMVHEVRRLTVMGPAGGRWEILASGDAFSVGPCTFRFELGAEEEGELAREVPNILRSSARPPDEGAQPEGASPSGAPSAEDGPRAA